MQSFRTRDGNSRIKAARLWESSPAVGQAPRSKGYENCNHDSGRVGKDGENPGKADTVSACNVLSAQGRPCEGGGIIKGAGQAQGGAEMTLRELRQQNKKTAAEVASVLGVALSTWYHYENGIREIRLAQVLMLSALFDVAVEEVIEAQLESVRRKGQC